MHSSLRAGRIWRPKHTSLKLPRIAQERVVVSFSRRFVGIDVLAAATRPSPITHVATGTARSARATPASAGSSSANASCCPRATCTPCSHCHVNWPRSRSRTSGSSTAFCSAQAQTRCSRSQGIHGTSVRRSAPYLGPETAASSACPLRHRRRRSGHGSLWMDLVTPYVLPAGEGARTCLRR